MSAAMQSETGAITDPDTAAQFKAHADGRHKDLSYWSKSCSACRWLLVRS